MPKISVRVPHQLAIAEAFARLQKALEKTVVDFQGRELSLNANDTSTSFSFKSLAFTIQGQAKATPDEVAVDVDLPFAALMFKDKAERAIAKNLTRALQSAATDEASS